MNLTTYLRAGYPGLAVISSEEARAEAEIASACHSLNRQLHAWSSTEGLVDTGEGRITPCPDPLDALQLLDGMFAADSSSSPRHVVLLRDLQLHLDQSDPMLVRRIKDILRDLQEFPQLFKVLMSNGMLLDDPELFDLVVNSIDRLGISIEGATKETFEKIRKGANFDRIINNVRSVQAWSKANGDKIEVVFGNSDREIEAGCLRLELV